MMICTNFNISEMSLNIRICQRILQHKIHPALQHRHLITTSSYLMPRKGRLELKEDADHDQETLLMSQSDQISDLLSRARQLDDLTSITSFGSIRLDRDNLPEDGASSVINPGLGKSFTESVSASESPVSSDYLGLPYDGDFAKFTAFSPGPGAANTRDDRKFAFVNGVLSVSST